MVLNTFGVLCKHHYYLPSELFPSFQTGTSICINNNSPYLTLPHVCTYFYNDKSWQLFMWGFCFIFFQVEEAGLINHPPGNWKSSSCLKHRERHGMMTLGPSGAGKTTCTSIPWWKPWLVRGPQASLPWGTFCDMWMPERNTNIDVY